MTDTLRDRIVAVLYEDGQRPMATAARLADAVIAALRLDIEHGCPTAGHHGCRCAHRYVTEWSDDEVQ